MKGGDGGDKAANGDADGAYDDEDSKNDDHKADEKVRSTLIQMKLSIANVFQITMIFTMKVITTDLLTYRLHPAETQKKKAVPPLVNQGIRTCK